MQSQLIIEQFKKRSLFTQAAVSVGLLSIIGLLLWVSIAVFSSIHALMSVGYYLALAFIFAVIAHGLYEAVGICLDAIPDED